MKRVPLAIQDHHTKLLELDKKFLEASKAFEEQRIFFEKQQTQVRKRIFGPLLEELEDYLKELGLLPEDYKADTHGYISVQNGVYFLCQNNENSTGRAISFTAHSPEEAKDFLSQVFDGMEHPPFDVD